MTLVDKKIIERNLEVNFCNAFLQKIEGKHTIENKLRYLLEDFFYAEGWMSKTNPKAMKEGYHQEFTYSKANISHFIEDSVRLFKREWELECKLLLKVKNKKMVKEKDET